MSRYLQESMSFREGVDRMVDRAMRKRLVSGASELDLVRSGLDATMRIAFQNLREVMKRNPAITDYRTTAYALALEKIVQNYPRNRSWTGWCVRFLGCRARHKDAD